MLTVRNLDVYYGRLRAVRDVTLSVPPACIVTVLGANGAGKTSVLRAIAGLGGRTRGTIEWHGKQLNGIPPHQRVAAGIATVSDGRELFDRMSVAQNLRLGAYRRNQHSDVNRDLDWVYSLFPPLQERREAHAGLLSGGQAQMLAIGRALMAAPRLLLLDEPSHGLAPNLVSQMFALLPTLIREREMSILLVEQNANAALSTASYGYVLESGGVALEGPTSDLQSDTRVRALYLGS